MNARTALRNPPVKREWFIPRVPNLTSMACAALIAAVFLRPAEVWAGGVVANCTEADLRAAMAGGGNVKFACGGTITLTSTITNVIDTMLDGSGQQVTISGGDAVRVFYVQSNVTFSVNHLTIAHGRNTNGAGILNDHGTVNATDITFDGNAVLGAAGPIFGQGAAGESVGGGAVANFGAINLVNCSCTGNSALGGAGSTSFGGSVGFPGGSGAGGAVWNAGVLTGSGCTFAGNSAGGGKGGNGSTGPFPPWPGGDGGAGGDGSGGALFNSGVARLVNCTLASNSGAGAAGGEGGPGYPAPPYPPPGPNGASGLGFGGIYDASGQCYLTNCTVAFNSCTGASGSPGSLSCGGIRTSGASMINTLLAANLPGANCLGVITDLGHNLSSDTTCAFTNIGSMNNTFPLLGTLTNNGGPTATIALLPGSRAIDAGDNTAAPPTDQRGVPRPFGIAVDIGAYECNSLTNPGPSTVVTECTEAALRAAMSAGGTVTFACDGTITLSSTIVLTTNTALDAAGHQITISGGGVRVFYVNAGVAFSLANLAVANGNAPSGAGIFNAGGHVSAANCVFSGNNAAISGVLARGGAIRNESGEVQLSGCVFAGNSAQGAAGASGLSGGSGWGGALDNSGTLTADLCTFIANSAVGAGGLPDTTQGHYGTAGGSGGDGWGGAIYNSGTMTILRSTFTNNSAGGGTGANGTPGFFGDPGMNGGPGGPGGSGGGGEGGALYNIGTVRVAGATFAFNSGSGANGGTGAYGGASVYGSGGNGGRGGAGGTGVGAVFNSGDLQLINTTFAFNLGSGGRGATAGGGGNGVFGGNGAAGGNGGSAFGAISFCSMTNCTVASNSGSGGAGGLGGSPGYGSYQSGIPGAWGSPGSSTGGIGGGTVINTLLASNIPGNDTFPDAKLGPLANNGGPTLTMALLPGSPAIDAADTSAAPSTDQRGFPRPAGPAADIGAYEYGSILPVLSICQSTNGGMDILACGNTNQSFRLLMSVDMSNWVPVGTNQFGSDGTCLHHDNCNPAGACRFYRVVMP